MARLAMAVAVLAACGDNVEPAMCDGIEPVFAHVVPLHTIARALPAGEILLAGTFRDTVVLGGQTLTSVGGADLYVARVASDGRITVATYGDAEDQELLELAVTSTGAYAIAGRFRGTLDLGGGALTATGTSSMFVAGFRPDGTLRSSTRYPVEAILRALAISPAGDLAIAGTNFDPIDFGGGALATGGQFLGVLDTDGNYVTHRALALEDKSVNLDVGLAFDGDELVVAGSYTSSIDLGGGPLPSAGALDFYLARFARGGAHRTSRHLGGPGNDGYRGFDGDRISIAAVAGGIVLASGYTGMLDLGDGPHSTVDDQDDIFVLRLDDAFVPVWNQTFAYPSFQAIGALAIANDGAIAITGSASGETLAGSPAACGGAEASHAFATTFDPDGHVRWSRCFPAEFAAGLSVAFRGTEELVLAGTFSGTLELGSTRLASENLSGFVAGVRPTCVE